MDLEFFLASHDYVSSPEPRKCQLFNLVKSSQGTDYWKVNLDPPLPRHLVNSPDDIDVALLAPCNPEMKPNDVGKKTIMVDILYSRLDPSQSVEESDLVRIGVGTIHASYAEALEHSPLD
jgi:hypothetical protein